MRNKILSCIIAFAMIFSTAAVSFAGTTGDSAKVKLQVTSGNTDIVVTVDGDYSMNMTVDTDGTVNKNKVTAALTMKDVASLGIEGERTEEFTLVTGLGDSATEFEGLLGSLQDFDGVTVAGWVNGLYFEYEIEGTYADKAWTGKATEGDINAAWHELAAHMTTATGEANSNIAIKEGTTIQIGNEILTFTKDLTVDDLNSQNDNMTGQILDAVTFEITEECEGSYVVYLPEGSGLQVGFSSAVLSTGATIVFSGVDLEAKGISMQNLKEYANKGDAQNLVLEAISLMNGTLAAVNETNDNDETLAVDIYTDCVLSDAECPAAEKCNDGCWCNCNIEEPDTNVYRIYGDDRYATSREIADELKATLGVDEFENIIIASGADFPDALAGSYLASEKEAPILLINKSNASKVKKYVANNLAEDGTVYVLGGTGVIPDKWVKGIATNVTRLGGDDRYETNMEILNEIGSGHGYDILICTGTGFADSLSASATGNPIMLVGNKLTADQKKYLKANPDSDIYVIGGTGAVSKKVAKACEAYDYDSTVDRVAGDNRYETSTAVAEEFFAGADSAVLAYALDYPDGLCGGVLAYYNYQPLILTANSSKAEAVSYAKESYIDYGYVLGGPKLISDKTVKAIFQMEKADEIIVK